jgi:hypothetical protein
VGFVVGKVALGQFFPEYFGLSLLHSFHWCSITRKRAEIIIIIIIIILVIIKLHKKPEGCGASIAFAAGPFSTKKKLIMVWDFIVWLFLQMLQILPSASTKPILYTLYHCHSLSHSHTGVSRTATTWQEKTRPRI